MNSALPLLLVAANLSCATKQAATESVARPGHFRYDPSTGTCLDGSGNVGHNETTLAAMMASRDGECVDFTTSALKGLNDLGDFVSFEGWNLRGADFGHAALMYTRLLGADLSGARLSETRFFYYCLSGRIDRHTTLPEGVSVTGDTVEVGDSCP